MARVTKKIVLSITIDDEEDTDPKTWNWTELIGDTWATGPAGPGEIAVTTFAAARGVEWDEELQQWITEDPTYY